MTLANWILLIVLVLAAAIDARKGIIPNVLVAAGLIAAVIWLVTEDRLPVEELVSALWLSLVLFGVRHLGYRLFDAPGMGWGDIKLVAVIGLFSGFSGFWILYCAVILAGVYGAFRLADPATERRTRIAFAPFLLAGFLLVEWVDPIGRWVLV